MSFWMEKKYNTINNFFFFNEHDNKGERIIQYTASRQYYNKQM